MNKNLLIAMIYFLFSTVITWWFVVLSPLYISQQQMLLSTSIAGGKWAIQIGLGFLLLKEKRKLFLREIGYVCLIGSLLLFPYVVTAYFSIANSAQFFVGSLIVAVLTMIYLYFKAIRIMKVSLYWWLLWLLCLAIAISLQLTVVFHVI